MCHLDVLVPTITQTETDSISDHSKRQKFNIIQVHYYLKNKLSESSGYSE